MTTIPQCKRCNNKLNVRLRRQINGNGSTVFCWYCVSCDHVADNQSPWIKKSIVEQWVKVGKLPSIEVVPIVNDYRENHACIVCGAIGGEYHHWLPQCFAHLVDDHSKWPGEYLCKSCHDTWHEIVTPYLPGRGSTELARYTKEKYYEHV